MSLASLVLLLLTAWMPLPQASDFEERLPNVAPARFAVERVRHCAGYSLVILGRLLGHKWEEAEVSAAFPPWSETPSVQEVLTAARKLGLNLHARRVGLEAAVTLTKPAMALIPATDPTMPGHYVVIRPLANRPGVWQVIDSQATPLITTSEAVVGDGELLILTPAPSPSTGTLLAIGLVLISLVLFLAWRLQVAGRPVAREERHRLA